MRADTGCNLSLIKKRQAILGMNLPLTNLLTKKRYISCLLSSFLLKLRGFTLQALFKSAVSWFFCKVFIEQ